MNDYIMIKDYLYNDKYRKSFNKLAINTFGLDFEEWFQKKLFFNRYICYSYLYKDEIIANVSINKMDIVVEGENKKAIQLGTVMTHPNYRNQGLAASLINKVIEEYDHEYDIIYLFANDSVLDFYPKFGFKSVIEGAYELDVKQLKIKKALIRKLEKDNAEDYEIILRLVSNRQPVSQRLGLQKDIWPLLVYCLYECNEDLYYLTEKDVIVIIKRKEGRLHIFDILSSKSINLDDIIEKTVMAEDEVIEFHFIPEPFKYSVFSTLKKRSNNTLFVRSRNNLFKEVLFPTTSHT